jgi:hypothetical protein
MALLRRIVVAATAMALLHAGALAQSGKIYRVGLVGIGAPDTGILGPGVERDFAQRGYVVGQNLILENAPRRASPTGCPASSTSWSPAISTSL